MQQEFSSDKATKAKSDAIEIPKGAATEAKKKKDEEEIVFKKDTKKKAEPVEVEQPKPVEAPAPIQAPPPPPPPPPPTELMKIEAPELEGPKILDKIDLDALDSSTRPKKGSAKKKKAEVDVVPEPAPAVVQVEPEEKKEVVVEEAAPAAAIALARPPAPTPRGVARKQPRSWQRLPDVCRATRGCHARRRPCCSRAEGNR